MSTDPFWEWLVEQCVTTLTMEQIDAFLDSIEDIPLTEAEIKAHLTAFHERLCQERIAHD